MKISRFQRLVPSLMILALAALPFRSQTLAQSGAKAFIRQIYVPYGNDATYSSLGPDRKKIYSPDLNRLIEADRKRTPVGFQGVIDSDPLCDCQDSEDLKVLQITSTAVANNKANAIVTLQISKNPATKKVLNLRLIRGSAGWRVDDVTSPKGLSLRQRITSPRA